MQTRATYFKTASSFYGGPVFFNLCIADNDILSYVRYSGVDKMHRCRSSEEVTFRFTKLLFTVK